MRALWLLGLREPRRRRGDPHGLEERVAQAHPDRRLDNNEAATRLTAAFNDARDMLRALGGDRAAVAGAGPPCASAWLYDGADEASPDDDDEPAPPRRVPTPEEERGERRAGLRPGDNVRPVDGDDVWRVGAVTASDTTGPVTVELEDGRPVDARPSSSPPTAARVRALRRACGRASWPTPVPRLPGCACAGSSASPARSRPC